MFSLHKISIFFSICIAFASAMPNFQRVDDVVELTDSRMFNRDSLLINRLWISDNHMPIVNETDYEITETYEVEGEESYGSIDEAEFDGEYLDDFERIEDIEIIEDSEEFVSFE